MQNEVKTFASSRDGVEQCLLYLDTFIKERELILQGLLIDGEIKYTDFEQHLLNRDASRVEAVLQTASEARMELLEQAQQYIQGAIPAIRSMSEQFIATPKPHTWDNLTELLDGIDWLLQMCVVVNQTAAGNDDLTAIQTNLTQFVEQFESAVENNDLGLIADLLQYELIAGLERLKTVLHYEINEAGR